jgi:hypothetical protein
MAQPGLTQVPTTHPEARWPLGRSSRHSGALDLALARINEAR